jgi:Protein of unknown function (DUF2568)
MHKPEQNPTTRPPAMNMANAALRFALELAALGAMGRWGWTLSTSGLRYLTMLVIPAFAATLWGTFTVPLDPSRGKDGPVPIPGIVRLGLEAAFFGFAVWAVVSLGHTTLARVYGALIGAHYVLGQDRTRWLLKRAG